MCHNAAAQCPVPPVKNTGAVPDSRLEGEARMIEIISDTRKCYGCYRGYSKKYYKGFKIKNLGCVWFKKEFRVYVRMPLGFSRRLT